MLSRKMGLLIYFTFPMPSAAQVLERHAVSPCSSVRVIPSLSSTCLISGMLTQLEAATATQGTNLWSRGEEDLARRQVGQEVWLILIGSAGTQLRLRNNIRRDNILTLLS